jgi:hypothetical protein
MWWMNIIVVALLAFGIFGFVSLVRLFAQRLTSETTQRAEDMYDQYADSPRERHRRSLAPRRYCPVLPNRVPNSPLRFAARSWGLAGLAMISCSPRAQAGRSSRGQSVDGSTCGAPRLACAVSACMTPGVPAVRCWRPSTCTRAWPCGFSGIARSLSRWSSARWSPTRQRWLRSATLWAPLTLPYQMRGVGARCCTPLLYIGDRCSKMRGAKGTRTPGLLDANQIFGVFLRRLASPDEAPTCADRRRVSAHVARSRTPLALCLALLRHPSGLGDATCGARRFAPAASPQLAVTGFLSSRNQEMAGQSTNLGQMALARLSA